MQNALNAPSSQLLKQSVRLAFLLCIGIIGNTTLPVCAQTANENLRYVSGDGVALRAAPDMAGKVLARLTRGDEMIQVDDEEANGFCRVKLKHAIPQGIDKNAPLYVSCRYLSTTSIVKPMVVVDFHKQYSQGTFPRMTSWQGLYCNKSGCEIRNAPLRITTTTIFSNVDEVNMPLDVLNIDDAPVALFYNMPLMSGKVTTWFVATEFEYDSAHYSELRKLGRWKMPWGSNHLTISRVRLPEYGGYRYHISDGIQKQFMFSTSLEGHYGGNLTPYIRWVGDLDGDGKIDLILSMPDDNCGFDERLYLSSQAGNGLLLRKAAQLSGGQAACGC